MTIAICDDIWDERVQLEELLSGFFNDVKFFQYENGHLLIRGHKESMFDLIFLDVLMPALNGIEIAREIRGFDSHTPIVFITTTGEFALQSYRVLAFDYLLKPINEAELKCTLQRLSFKKHESLSVEIEYKGVPMNILLRNIIYLESDLRRVYFHLAGGKCIFIVAKLGDFEKLTCDGFCRCHKSFMVNLFYVRSISGEFFNMSGEFQIKISRQYLSNTKKTYFSYVFQENTI